VFCSVTLANKKMLDGSTISGEDQGGGYKGSINESCIGVNWGENGGEAKLR